MTLILGVEDPDNARALIFADSGCWAGNSFVHSEVTPKIWRDRHWIVGCAGHYADIQLAQRMRLPEHQPGRDGVLRVLSDWNWNFTEEVGKNHAALTKAQDGARWDSPCLIVGIYDQIWHVEDLSVTRARDGFNAAGAIGHQARFAMRVLKYRDNDPKRDAVDVMKIATETTDSARGPIRWFGTDGTEGELG